jgi:hypothetical protein
MVLVYLFSRSLNRRLNLNLLYFFMGNVVPIKSVEPLFRIDELFAPADMVY